MGHLEFITDSEAKTEAIGEKLAKHAFPGAFLALSGGLGAGKTALARGFGRGLGVDDILSPTFSIIHVHEGELPLCHIDVYRLHGENELYNVGYEEYLSNRFVVIMEWPELVINALPAQRLELCILGSGSQPRRIVLTSFGSKHALFIEALKQMEDANADIRP